MNSKLPHAELPVLVILYVSGEEFSRSRSPNLDVAKGHAHWHVSKSADNTAKIVDPEASEPIVVRHSDEQAIDIVTGEVVECPFCEESRIYAKGLERTNRGLILRMAQLTKDLEAEARGTKEWQTAMMLFDFWRVACNHKSSKFTLERFQQVLPYLKKYKMEHLFMAIAGANYDPFITERKNGTEKRHNDWSLIFRDAAHMEEFACKCPKGFVPPNLLT